MADIPPSAQASVAAIALWPADLLARHLISGDPITRTVALGMAVQPGAPIDSCVEALVASARLGADDALACQLSATALGGLSPSNVNEAVQSCLATFVATSQTLPVRIAAAHALFRLACLPAAAHVPLCSMLLDVDSSARKVALLAVSALATSMAGTIARQVAAAAPATWTVELLQALVESTGGDAMARGKVEDFVSRSLADAPLLPAGIAAYTLLVRVNPQGAALTALVRIAGEATDVETSIAALEALGALGEAARPAAKRIAQSLVATEDPAREELLCRTLVRLRSPAKDLPMARVLQRVQAAPDRSTAAHCMLMCLHPKEFPQAASLVRQRCLAAGDALQKALAQTYKTLTGTEMTGPTVAGKV